MEEDFKAFELYKEAYKKRIINSFKDLELPPEWRPREVLRFIAKKIEESE